MPKADPSRADVETISAPKKSRTPSLRQDQQREIAALEQEAARLRQALRHTRTTAKNVRSPG